MQKKIKVYYFHNGSGGGVLSVIKNLVRFLNRDKFENHIIYTISQDNQEHFSIPTLSNICRETIFYYSSKWNFYYTCKKLSQLLPDENAVIVANDWLELGMVSHKGLSNPVIQILHGNYDYYYNLSLKHSKWINAFATVAQLMADNLRQKLQDRIGDIYYLPFPVQQIEAKEPSTNYKSLQIIFVGRLTKDKGYNLLPFIQTELAGRGVKVQWHVVGATAKDLKLPWVSDGQINFYGQCPNEKVIELMREMDCLLLPSLAEGMPVVLVEAMKVGLTCIANDLPGGIQELIEDGVTGFKVKKNELTEYVNVLEQLFYNREILQTIGKNAKAKANSLFNPIANAANYEQLIEKCFYSKREAQKARKIYGSRLDQTWIPNVITMAIRNFQ
jgi:glycosyltransferase involved in cell wall biosynthesis